MIDPETGKEVRNLRVSLLPPDSSQPVHDHQSIGITYDEDGVLQDSETEAPPEGFDSLWDEDDERLEDDE